MTVPGEWKKIAIQRQNMECLSTFYTTFIIETAENHLESKIHLNQWQTEGQVYQRDLR